jgi:peptidoglycan hydrolase-like protein with peptidoglycan-binding domain
MLTRPPDVSRRPGSSLAGWPPPAGRRARRLAAAAILLILVAVIGFAARSRWAGPGRPAPAAAAVPVSTAAVIRTDISARQVVSGTLGYQGAFAVVNELPAGIITWLPAAGQVVRRGQALYQLAGQAVTLLYGRVPAWRPFGPDMIPGPDIRELQQNLVALGFDPWHQITADGQFDWATAAAIDRWQLAHGWPETGTIPLGEVMFLTAPLRVAAVTAAMGTPAGPGAPVLTGTSDRPSVSVSLTVGGPAVRPGDQVAVTMPDGTTTVPGTVAAVGNVASTPTSAAPGTSGTQAAVIPVTIRIGASQLSPGLDQAPVQVAITEQRHRDVLAVPVTALLALPGGGYAVRTAGPEARLIPVTLGLFDDDAGLVEVTGPALAAGLTVAAAQG